MERLKNAVEKKFDYVFVNTKEVVEMDLYDLVPIEIHEDNFHDLDLLNNFVAQLGYKVVVHSIPKKQSQFYIKIHSKNWSVSILDAATTCLLLLFHATCVFSASIVLFGSNSLFFKKMFSFFSI